MRRIPSGFTLIELLALAAILAVLAALLVPAVQHAREASNRARCAANLRQIGIALLAYHEATGSLPIGCMEWRPYSPHPRPERQIAWSAFILPFIDAGTVHELINFNRAFDAVENTTAGQVRLGVYQCPTSQRRHIVPGSPGGCDYGGIYGERIVSANVPAKGTMLVERAIRLHEVFDGASKTLVVGEDSIFPDGQWINGRNIFDQAFAINAANGSENEIQSHHSQGAYGLFCDGSARFLSERMDLRMLAAICTRAGGEAGIEF